jgi:hypothetical protein
MCAVPRLLSGGAGTHCSSSCGSSDGLSLPLIRRLGITSVRLSCAGRPRVRRRALRATVDEVDPSCSGVGRPSPAWPLQALVPRQSRPRSLPRSRGPAPRRGERRPEDTTVAGRDDHLAEGEARSAQDDAHGGHHQRHEQGAARSGTARLGGQSPIAGEAQRVLASASWPI